MGMANGGPEPPHAVAELMLRLRGELEELVRIPSISVPGEVGEPLLEAFEATSRAPARHLSRCPSSALVYGTDGRARPSSSDDPSSTFRSASRTSRHRRRRPGESEQESFSDARSASPPGGTRHAKLERGEQLGVEESVDPGETRLRRGR